MAAERRAKYTQRRKRAFNEETAMKGPMKVAVIAFGMLAIAPVAAMAQTSGHEHAPGATSPRDAAPAALPMQGMMEQMQPMMERMQQTMRQMADGLKAGTMTPDQQKAMGQTLERMTGMMDQMHTMAHERQAMQERMSQMMQQMRQMRQRMDETTGRAPSAAPRDPAPPAR
jgi:hypothetical protein